MGYLNSTLLLAALLTCMPAQPGTLRITNDTNQHAQIMFLGERSRLLNPRIIIKPNSSTAITYDSAGAHAPERAVVHILVARLRGYLPFAPGSQKFNATDNFHVMISQNSDGRHTCFLLRTRTHGQSIKGILPAE